MKGTYVNRTDTELRDAVIAGEYQAFGILVDRYAQSVCRRIAARTNPWTDREVLCQDVFVKAHRKLTQLRDKNRFESWLCRIADNCPRESYRNRIMKAAADTIQSGLG